MAIKYILSFFLAFCLLTNIANAHIIEIEGKIFLNNTYMENLIIQSECNESLIFPLPQNAYNIISDINISNNTVNISNCNNNTNISYFLPAIEESDSGFYRIERKFESFAGYNYSYSLEMPILFMVNENLSSPTNFTINYSDEENKIISFSLDSNVYLIYYSEYEEENSISGSSVKYSYLFLLIAFLLGFLIAYFFFRMEKKKMARDNVPSYVLLEEEMKVLSIIKSSPGINQTQISKNLKFSKAKTSMIIKQLENKHLIEREKFGRSFKVYSSKTII